MDPDTIGLTLASLLPCRWSWRGDALPGADFLGRPLGLRVDTQPVPAGGPPPPLDAAEGKLARLVLANLPGVLAEAERRYRDHADSPDMVGRAREPLIWISRDVLAEEGPGRWALVVGLADAPDWGVHASSTGWSSCESGRATERLAKFLAKR